MTKRFFILWAWIFGFPVFNKFNRLIFSLSLRGMGVYNYTSLSLSGERWLIKNIVKRLGKDLLIFDVGANIGDYSKAILDEEVKVKQIFAFEPHPQTFERLKENTGTISELRPVQVALSDTRGKIILYDRINSKGSSHASLSEDIFLNIHQVESSGVPVEVNTIDIFCSDNNIGMIDFLKIDVEGFEFSVLKGSQDMLDNNKIRVIQFEFTQLNSTVGIFFKQIFNTLSDNYYIYRLLTHGLQQVKNYDATTCEIFGYQNFVAILKTEKL
jgi:FkbM family methyltransferase